MRVPPALEGEEMRLGVVKPKSVRWIDSVSDSVVDSEGREVKRMLLGLISLWMDE